MSGRPRKYTDEEMKQKIKDKNARYYEKNRDKWTNYNSNHTEKYFTSQIRHYAKQLDLETQAKVLQAIENVSGIKNEIKNENIFPA